MSVLFYPLLILFSILGGLQKDYKTIHKEAIIVDSHNDLLTHVMEGYKVEERSQKGHSDLVRFKEGGYKGQVFSVWVDPKWISSGAAFSYANKMIDSLDAICKRNPSRIVKVTNWSEFENAMKSGRLAAMIGLEGGHSIENSIDKLIHFYKRGMRCCGLTWNNSTDWATSSRDESTNDAKRKGLTDFGKRIIRTLDSLGVLIDVSHSGEQTVYDVLKTTTHPIIASHSSVYKICPHHRNLKDDQIKAIAKSGGVIMVNFYPAFIDSTFNDKKEIALRSVQKKLLSLEQRHKNNPDELMKVREQFFNSKEAKFLPSVKTIANHIDYIKKLVGIDYVGIGSDFDGIGITPLGLEDVTKLPNLTYELYKRGYKEDEIKKVLGGNFVRVFKQVCIK